MPLPKPFPRGYGLAIMLGLAVAPAAAAAAPVPQPRALATALSRLGLLRDEDPGRISNDRFPLHFPVDRSHGRWKSADGPLLVSIHGHGHSARRYQSLSLELLFGDSASFETGLAQTERVMATIGLPDDVRATAAEMLRVTHAQRQTERRTGGPWYLSVTHEAREVAGIQIRMRFRSLGHVFLQFTDADAPEARWPTRDEVEKLHPWSHRRPRPEAYDHTLFQEPVVTRLQCRAAGRGAFRCSYRLANDAIPGRPVDRYSGVFRRGPDGEWTVALDQPPHPPGTDD